MRLLRRGVGLRVARANRDAAETEPAQQAPDAALVQMHREARRDLPAQIAQPPAHDAHFLRPGPAPHPLRHLRLLLACQFRRRTAGMRTIRQAAKPLGIVAMHPVT